MGNSLLAVRDINHKYIVVRGECIVSEKKGESVVPILQKICRWSGIFYREDSENVMTQCQKCDYR